MHAAPARSYLFVPGNRPERFARACSSGAHAVIVDLEDAVRDAEPAATTRIDETSRLEFQARIAGWSSSRSVARTPCLQPGLPNFVADQAGP